MRSLARCSFTFHCRRLTRLLFLLTCFFIALVPPSAAQTSARIDSLQTIAGELQIIEAESHCKYQVMLAERIILQTDCRNEANKYYATPEPTIHTYHKALGGVAGFEEVVLFQMQMLGNACDGGDLIFLGLKKNQPAVLSNRIGFCGGRPPVITWAPDRVTVLIPGGPPNRGQGYLPPETWIYERGQVTKRTRSGRK